MLTCADVERALRRPPSDEPVLAAADAAERGLREAAVLCPIAERDGGLSVILTRRTEHLKAHPGQISFPGGKIDPGDATPLDAALRESHEEIGLDPGDVRIAGALDRYVTGTGFVVTPFVGFVPPGFDPVPEPGEVAEVFTIPAAHVLEPANYTVEARRWRGEWRRYYAVPYGPY